MGVKKENVVMIGESKYGVELNEYNDSISLNKVNKGANDVIFNEWCFTSKWQNGTATPDAKKRPMGVYLGKDKGAAIEVLKTLIAKLAGSEYPPEEVPF